MAIWLDLVVRGFRNYIVAYDASSMKNPLFLCEKTAVCAMTSGGQNRCHNFFFFFLNQYEVWSIPVLVFFPTVQAAATDSHLNHYKTRPTVLPVVDQRPFTGRCCTCMPNSRVRLHQSLVYIAFVVFIAQFVAFNCRIVSQGLVRDDSFFERACCWAKSTYLQNLVAMFSC